MSETITPPPDNRRAEARDGIRDLVARLDQGAAAVSSRDPDLSRTIGQLAASVDRAGATDDPRFRTRVAYAFQDIEKLAGPISSTPPVLRQEMEKLAATAPGLQNERLRDLVGGTKALADPELVRDIRQAATEVGRRPEQIGRDVQERVEALEARVRLSADPSSGTRSSTPTPPTSPTEPKQGSGAEQGSSPPPQRSPGAPNRQSADLPEWDRPEPRRPDRAESPAQGPAATEQIVQAQGPGLLNLAWGAVSRHREAREAQADRAPTPVGERSERHEGMFQQMRDQAVVQGAERSQKAALDALQGFANGPGSNVLGKIQDAAKNEPGGMQAVISEMKDGGRYANLRSQFNADMVMERGMAASYEKVAGTLQQYGADRAAVEALGAQRNTSAALSSKFEKMDAEIGKTAAMLPSKAEGKNLMEELGDKLREVLDRAVQSVRSAFTRSADTGANTSSGPSPSP